MLAKTLKDSPVTIVREHRTKERLGWPRKWRNTFIGNGGFVKHNLFESGTRRQGLQKIVADGCRFGTIEVFE